MKCRNGFVSNSSSSSFIVAFPKDMELSSETVKEYLFGDEEFIYQYDDKMTTENAAEIIVNGMKRQKPNDIENIRNNCNGWIDGAPNDKIYKKKNGEIDWKSCQKALDEHRDKHVENFMKKVKGKDVYVFVFSDNDGMVGAILEHGGTFDRVPHERISNH